MTISVARALQDPLFAKCRLLTGAEQAEASAIRWVSVIEVPVQRFVRRNEFVLTTAMNVGHDAGLLSQFVRRIASAKAAALAIAIGPYVREVPAKVVAVAASRNLALIEIRPWKLRFSEISERILQWLLEDQLRKKERDQFVWALATGRIVPDRRTAEHAQRLGASLDSDFYAIAALVRIADGAATQETEDLHEDILGLAESMALSAGMNWLGTTIGGRVIAFIDTREEPAAIGAFLNAWLAELKRRFPRIDVVAGASDMYRAAARGQLLTRFVDAANAASAIAELAAEVGGHHVARFREVAVDVLMRRIASDALAARLVGEYLKGLLDHDHARKVKLLPTLEKYLSSNCNVSGCARSLSIRRQSLIYRLEKIRGITGCDLDNAQQRFALQVALQLRTAQRRT